MSDLGRAVRALREGDLVVYPTETVYGLGADALDPDAVERVFETKGRDRSEPISFAFPDVDAALSHTAPTEREERFVREYLPGPVTVVVDRGPEVPDALTARRDRVGVRVPDHERARDLLREVAPITATSANVSGEPSVRRTEDLDPEIRETASVVLDAGETPGAASTVVDVGNGEVIREGPLTEEIRLWLQRE